MALLGGTICAWPSTNFGPALGVILAQYETSPYEQEIEDLSFGRISTVDAIRLQRHLFKCEACLHRLIEIETVLAVAERVVDLTPIVDERKPLFIVHETGDGMIYSRAEKRGRKWWARHWGDGLDGGRECETMREASGFLIASFREMFPEHRCTKRCRVNPTVTSEP
jgi:hypothetical protein